MRLVSAVIQRELRRCRGAMSATQRIVVTRKMIAPNSATSHQESVTQTIASASAAALTSGRMLGAGMWISSPTGGTVPLSSMLAHEL